MKSRLLIYLSTLVVSFEAQPLDVRAASVDPTPEKTALELTADVGQLALVRNSTTQDGKVDRIFEFRGSLLASSRTGTTGDHSVLIKATPVSWRSRLVTDGLNSGSKVFQLVSNVLNGAMIASTDGPQGGLVKIPGDENSWSAFIDSRTTRYDLAATELLYALILRADSTGRYLVSWFSNDGKVPAQNSSMTQYDALRTVAERRNELASMATGRPSTIAWKVITIRSNRVATSTTEDRASAILELDNKPLAAVQVIFSRAPHSGCVALTNSQGIAECILQDSHGDQHEHEEEASIVATFPGEIANDRTLPPVVSVVDN